MNKSILTSMHGYKRSLSPLPVARLFGLLLGLVFWATLQTAQAQTIVEQYGQLRVQNNRIVNKNGTAVQLRGMSLYWSQWVGKYYTYNTLKWLRDDWKVTVVRAAMAVDAGGYATNPTTEKNKVFAVIDAAISLGIYVVVDFHVHEAQNYRTQAQTFFREVAQKYGNSPNVLYEPWNEPATADWSGIIKPYHESIISTIRQYDSDNIIICGTGFYSQDVDIATNNPINQSNIAYTLHFYADTHKQSLRDKAQTALNRNRALFVTEYGTTSASGDGYVNEAETRTWWSFLDQNKISHANWSLSDIAESSSALYSGASVDGGWSTSQIKPSGQLVRNEIRTKNAASSAPCGVAANGFPICCNGSASDPDGDGWGWENNASCTVQSSGVSNGTYQITFRHSGKSLNVSGALTNDGADVVQWPYGGGNNEKWFVQSVGGGAYSIRNVNSGRGLDVVNNGTNDGADINQWYYSGANNQKWYIEAVSGQSGYYRLKNVNSGKCIEISGGLTTDGLPIQQWTCSDYSHQVVSLNKLSSATSRLTPDLEAPSLQGVMVYPNPTSGAFTINQAGDFSFTLINQVGQVVEEGKATDKVSLDHALPKGIYVLQLKAANQTKGLKLIKY